MPIAKQKRKNAYFLLVLKVKCLFNVKLTIMPTQYPMKFAASAISPKAIKMKIIPNPTTVLIPPTMQ